MQMDYDDNDISHHNLQLAGEGRTISAFALRPYDFPKFDFDDSIQGNLRFENLIETEVFLGIQSQEDNQWIEDFSRGSNGMEFNSTTADSCSVSRQNNVWSEAISSESVEMLLKSVGQEEMMPGASIISESNTSDDQGTLPKQANAATKLNEGNEVNVANSDASLLQDEVVKDYTSSRRHIEEQFREVDDPSVTHANVESISSNLAQNAVCGKDNTSTKEGKHSYHDESVDKNSESKTSVDLPVNCGGGGDSLGFNNIADSINSNNRMLNTSEASKQVNSIVSHETCNYDALEKHVSTEVALEDTTILDGRTGETSIHNHAVRSSLCLVPQLGVVDSQDAPEASCDSGRESANVLVEGESELKSSEGDDKNASFTTPVQSGKHEVEVLAVSNKLDDSFEVCQGGLSVDGINQNSAELGSLNPGHCASSEQKMDSSVQLTSKWENDKMEGAPANPLKCESISEMTLFSREDVEVPIASGDSIGNSNIGLSSDMAGLSSAAEHKQTENVEASRNDSIVTILEPGAHFSVHVTDDSRQVIEENLAQRQAVFSESEQDICKTKEARNKLPTDPGNMDSEYVETLTSGQRIQSLDVGREEKVNDIIMLQPQTSGEKESEIDKASCDSPTIISSSEPSGMEKNNQAEAGGCQVTDKFVEDIQPSHKDSKRKDALGDDSSFTFKVNALPDTTDKEPGNSWLPFPDVGKCKSSIVEGDSTPSGKSKTRRVSLQKTLRQSTQVSGGEHVQGTSKAVSERKGRRASAKESAKENSKKGNQVKGKNQESASVNVEKVSNILLATPSSSPHVLFGQMPLYGNSETSREKLSGAVAVAVPVSNLSDLNTSVLNSHTPSSVTFQQLFTDLQQVQLRAQIFIYGSLIQGTVPDEACMVSAFGPSDGGRSAWEPAWRVAVERVQSQKSSSSAAETSVCPQSGVRASDGVKQILQSNKVLANPVNRASSKDTPRAIVNPIIPLSSPLWSISTPYNSLPSSAIRKDPAEDLQQAVTPVHSHQTLPLRNLAGHTSWPSQICFPGPWMASPQATTFSSGVHFQPVTMTETVKLTPVKDTPSLLTSSTNSLTSSPAVHSLSPRPVHGGVSPVHDPKTVASAQQHSVDPKRKKRKKVPTSDPVKASIVSEAHAKPVVIPDVATLLSSPAGVQAPAFLASDAVLTRPVAYASGVSYIDCRKRDDLNIGKAVACSEETLSKVAEAKSQTENAADLASAAFSHCEDLWSQLTKQKESGLTSEAEAKLASAAVAIAAAASVAKAAAAAARIACNAAVQARQMADEVFLSSKTSGVVLYSGKSPTDMHTIGNATPASILKSKNETNQSSSILVAAKEAAKRRVEAAFDASKQAENLDAIVKAAELAATAVSQAGKIVAMGEPLPLNDLIEAGPEGYWKSPQPLDWAEKLRDGNKKQSGAIRLEEGAKIPAKDLVENRSKILGVAEMHPRERSNDSLVGCVNLSHGIMGSMHTDEKDFGIEEGYKASDTAKSSRVASVSKTAQGTSDVVNELDELMGTLAEDNIKEGSLVEVFKHGNGLKAAWYSAKVLSLEDGKAYVCYSNLLSEEGFGNLHEWVSLEGEGDKAPVIRAAYPLSALQYQPTRKRRRAAVRDYAWCAGDRVDVLIDDCWWEGVVTEKNEQQETTLKVHFPAQGETSIVRAWNLRASRSWVDGKWVECSSLRGHNASEQDDAPQEKRQKLGSPSLATKAKDKLSIDVDSGLGKPDKSKFLTLSTSERMFDIGKSTKEDNKYVARRPLRTGQQKEGSRVIFGVPKPTGKKRKYMEVSKHFAANKGDKGIEANDSIKFAKYLIPQGTTSRGWKVPSRNDSKEKRTVESKPRVPSTHKAHHTLPQRDKLKSSLAHDTDNSANHRTNVEGSVDHDENTSQEMIDLGIDASEEAAEAPLSSLLPHSLSTSFKKISSLNSKSDQLNRKLAPSGEKLIKIEDKVGSSDSGKSVAEVAEPRRSNRRMLPTNRLLEGLQSSMIIPKVPFVPHVKGRRNVSTRGEL